MDKYAFNCIFITATLSDCPAFSTDSPRMCRLGMFSMFYPVPRQDFGGASPLFSGAHSLGYLPRRVSGEQRGGAAEILSRNGVEWRKYSIYTSSGGIRTHLYLLEM